ncbi:hypothetical protein BKA80DRAFT_7032 [Phyllosticta citrichinensis]
MSSPQAQGNPDCSHVLSFLNRSRWTTKHSSSSRRASVPRKTTVPDPVAQPQSQPRPWQATATPAVFLLYRPGDAGYWRRGNVSFRAPEDIIPPVCLSGAQPACQNLAPSPKEGSQPSSVFAPEWTMFAWVTYRRMGNYTPVGTAERRDRRRPSLPACVCASVEQIESAAFRPLGRAPNCCRRRRRTVVQRIGLLTSDSAVLVPLALSCPPPL